MNELKDEPLGSVEWVDADELKANAYNPNHVATPEMKLLEHSILTNGWIQPVLASRDSGVIIDGFHRWLISRESKKMGVKYGGKLPVVYLDVSDVEAKLLTVRINRAKGEHSSSQMSALVRSVIEDHGLTIEEVMEGIGAGKKEVELLLMPDVFKARKIAEHKYSRAWYPVEAEVNPE